MEEVKEERKVHHGRNLKAARIWKGIKQHDFGDKIGLSQCEVSTLESTETIEKEKLELYAQILDVDIKFLETFVPEEHMSSYTVNNVNKDTSTGHSTGYINNETNNYNLSFQEVQKLIEDIRKQERENADMRVLLAKNGIDYTPRN